MFLIVLLEVQHCFRQSVHNKKILLKCLFINKDKYGFVCNYTLIIMKTFSLRST